MNCEHARRLLASFLDGRLSGDLSREVRGHLAACAGCRSGLSSLDRVEALTAFDEAIEPSADLPRRFRSRLAEHRRRLERPAARDRSLLNRYLAWGWQRQFAAAASLVLLFSMSIYVGKQLSRSDGEARAASEIGIAENLPLLLDMGVIENLDLLQDFDLIQNLSAGGKSPAER
jgi:predicted anti-sigma-YlaC factor YlaD